MSVVQTMAEWSASTRLEDVPDSARHAARRVLMDQVGISIAGAALSETSAVRRLRVRAEPLATCWSDGVRTQAPYAALVNRCAGDALELTAGPECVAAAAAAAEVAGATLGDLLLGIVIAAEIEAYLRRWLLLPLERHGLHPPAAVGVAGAAAAVSSLLRLDASSTADAIATAASLGPLSPYVAFSRGASSKTLYGGWSQMLGLWSALWASRSIHGPRSVMEGPRGVARALLDAGAPVDPPPFEPSDWAIERVTFKAFPCSRACHPALTALERLAPLEASAIREVRVWSYPFSVELDRRGEGDSPIAAQMSLRRTLALRLALGELVPGKTYTRENVHRPEVVELASRIAVEVESSFTSETDRVRRARIQVVLRDGTRREAEAEARWGPDSPASDEELRARFVAFTRGRRALDPWERAPSTPVAALLREESGG